MTDTLKVLDWPDATGPWWCDHQLGTPVFAYASATGVAIEYTMSFQSRKTFEANFGPGKFTPLIEQNPFTLAERLR